MEKTIGYRIIIDVSGFQDAKHWIYRCVKAGIVKCSQCDKPASGVWWNDAAEWYCECSEHRSYQDQWTGSTRWNPIDFSMRVFKEAAEAFRASLTEDERAHTRIQSFDATDYYSLFVEGYWKTERKHYFRGSAEEYGWRLYACITPLTNGEFVYELHNDHTHEHGGTGHSYGIRGAYASEALAIEAAKKEAVKRGMLPESEPKS